MKNNSNKLWITLFTTLIFLILLSPATALSEKIQWQNYEKGIAMAKAQGKKVFLYFHADWCGYCTKMKKTTFKDNSVIRYLNDNFIAISVDSDREKKIAGSYGVRGLPTYWLLKEDSTKLSSLPGYVDAERLLVVLKYIKTESYGKMSFNDFGKTL